MTPIEQSFDHEDFYEKYHYDGADLGAVYTREQTSFRVWAPTADHLQLRVYNSGHGGTAVSYPMEPGEQGTWVAAIEGDLHGVYYTYQVTHKNRDFEVVDPYARAVGVNGNRGMVVDLARANPEGWEEMKEPPAVHPVDLILYELHIRDLSIHPNSGIKNKGKYLGLTESGTRGPRGVKTGLDHIKELGITHLHLLPVFDFYTIDETRLDEPQYNWGYDPQNYSAPEGSYSTDPYNGLIRIREFKEMVKTLKENGIRVVMDVVYNHTFLSANSHLHRLVPGYYHRLYSDGSFSNGSGTGNEIASERSMVRKMIVDSVVYWAREYRIDGFRFDLMGLHDLTTMNAIRRALDKVAPGILLYGEGWTAGYSLLPRAKAALKENMRYLPGIAAFNDHIRDGIRGSVFDFKDPGFINGAHGMEETVKFGIVAATLHPQLNYTAVKGTNAPWAVSPGQSVTYCEAHDNHTLWDRLQWTASDYSEEEKVRIDQLAAAIVLTSQGIPFLHAGQDFLRTKDGVENSYASPDKINWLDWLRKARYDQVFKYIQGLIALRKAHPAFRMRSAEDIQRNLVFLDLPNRMIGYTLIDHANGDPWETIVVLFNSARIARKVKLPGRHWVAVADGHRAGITSLKRIIGDQVTVSGLGALILADMKSFLS